MSLKELNSVRNQYASNGGGKDLWWNPTEPRKSHTSFCHLVNSQIMLRKIS